MANHDDMGERESVRGRLEQAIAQPDRTAARADLARAHPAEIADVIESIGYEQRRRVWQMLEPAVRGKVLLEVHGQVRDQLIEDADPSDLITAIGRLQADKLADLDARLPPTILEASVRAMDADRRRRYEQLRAYPDDTAGGLMDADALTVRADASLALAQHYLQDLRRRNGTLPEHIDNLIVVDAEGGFAGVVSLAALLTMDPSCSVRDAMSADVAPISVDTPATRVARLFQDHDWISAPVVDARGLVVGRITIDDVVDVIRTEGESAALRAVGLSDSTDLLAPVVASVRRRTPWLGVNLLNGLAAAWVIHLFGAEIEQVVALAVLMPVVAGMGGVTGIQTLTLVTRAMALDHINVKNARRVLANEIGAALVNGMLWAGLIAGVVVLWLGNTALALVFGIALLFNMLNGAISGTVIPLLLRRLGMDPAVAGGVLLSAATDIFGFACFLGLAAVIVLP